ncbi:MAG TPA: hypothetical protein VJN93_16665 [Candidatus Acidoferrum sp.]|nr:hypothetical protein [Candidatus Acidoferrum sp.]
MNENQDRFENFLREFEPRRPRPLERRAAHRLPVWRLAAAAVILLAMGAGFWSVHRKKNLEVAQSPREKTLVLPATETSNPEPLLLPLTELALNDPEQLDAELAKASRKLLPNFRKGESTLRVLAKE